MKIREIELNEASRTLGALKGLAQGGLAGAAQGWKSAGAANKEQTVINNVASRAVTEWAKQEQRIKSSGQVATPNDVVDWFRQFTGGKGPKQGSIPSGTSPAAVSQWLRKEVASYVLQKSARPSGVSGTSVPRQEEPAPAGAEVDTPLQGKVTKRQDGKWYNEQGQQIVNPTDISKLEKQVSTGEKIAQPAAPEGETITIGGQKLNPKNPKDAELIKKLQAQMKQQPEVTSSNEPVSAPADNSDLPDVSKLTPEERAELRKQLVASMQVTQ